MHWGDIKSVVTFHQAIVFVFGEFLFLMTYTKTTTRTVYPSFPVRLYSLFLVA